MRKVIEVKHLYKLYRLGNEVVRALDGVDFTIYELPVQANLHY